MRGSANSLKRMTALFFSMAVFAGCVTGQYQYDEGLALLDEGKTIEGLAKLQEAVKADPDNVAFRVSLARNREQAIGRLLTAANNERIAGHGEVAQAIYMKALEIDPNNGRARVGLAVLEMDKRHEKVIAAVKELLKKGDADAAGDALRPVLLENPDNTEAQALRRKMDELIENEKSAGPSLTEKFKKPISMEFRDANVKMVFEALSRTSGINVLLDKDVKPDLKTSIFVKDASVEDTIDLIRLQSQLEKKILNENTVFLYPKTPEKSREYQDLKVRSFHLTNADPKQVLAMLKALLKIRDIYVNEKTNSIVMRDTPEAIRLAEKLIADQDIPEPEVMLEVEILEVQRNRLTQLGINWPDHLTLTAMGTVAATPAGTNGVTVQDLRGLNGSSILTSPALAVTLNALMQDSETNILASPRIRARNREKARIMIGDRVPVITNAVTPVSTGAPVVTGSVQYLDVGLKLEVEPDIHLDNEVAIKVNMEVSSISKEVPNAISGTLAYQVGTRNASTLLQLKNGETQILAGLINKQEQMSADKVPGLGQLPILGHLFSSDKNDNTRTEIVLSITPHIVGRSRIPDARETEFWSGTEANLRDSQLLLRPIGARATPVAGASRQPASAAAPVPPVAISPPATAAPLPLATPGATGTANGAAPVVLSWQGPDQAKVGDTVAISLNAQSSQGMNNLGLLVTFDPAVLKAVDVAEGNALKLNNMQSNFTSSINQAGGRIEIDLAGPNTGTGTGEAGADGTVAVLTFQVTGAAPPPEITLSRVVASQSGHELAYSAPAPYVLAVVQ